MSDQLKLSRGVAKKAKKAATGPLFGPVVPAPATAPEAVAATVATLGTIQAIRARIGDPA